MSFDSRHGFLLGIYLSLGVMAFGGDGRASAPPGRYEIGPYGATVRDVKTGLTWQRGSSAKCHLALDPASYCTSLSLGEFTSGWRLPTKKELETLVDVAFMGQASRPTIDEVAFPDTYQDDYCTSSPYLGWSYEGKPLPSAFRVSFATGATTYSLLRTDTCRVRCVRN
jgi:hypothetical protein